VNNIFSNDSDWSIITDDLCKVTKFETHRGKAARATVTLDSLKIPANTIGTIFHKLDLQHLREAFAAKGNDPKMVVAIEWSKRHLTGVRKLLSPFMPRLFIMVMHEDAFELLINRDMRPELRGEARANAMKPIAMWEPLSPNGTFLE
jgi:hypothetical protein